MRPKDPGEGKYPRNRQARSGAGSRKPNIARRASHEETIDAVKAQLEEALRENERLRRLLKHAGETEGGAVKGTPPPAMLTPRECQVLALIARGHSTKQLAELLGITFKTASTHRSRIMEKLGVHETASLVRLAIRFGLAGA